MSTFCKYLQELEKMDFGSMKHNNQDPISFAASLEINEDMFSNIIEEFCSCIDDMVLVHEKVKKDDLVFQNEEVTIHKVVERDVKSKLLLQEESCHKAKFSPLMLKSKEDIDEDMFWDDLENFFLNLDAKQVPFIEQNHEQQEQSAEFFYIFVKSVTQIDVCKSRGGQRGSPSTQKHQGGF